MSVAPESTHGDAIGTGIFNENGEIKLFNYDADGVHWLIPFDEELYESLLVPMAPLEMTPPPLTADATAEPAFGPHPLAVTFSSATSIALEFPIATYAWVFGDGGTSTSANPTHTFSAVGSYTVGLTVTDTDGATDTDTVLVTAT